MSDPDGHETVMLYLYTWELCYAMSPCTLGGSAHTCDIDGMLINYSFSGFLYIGAVNTIIIIMYILYASSQVIWWHLV